jgi:hypothetical protein
MSATLQKSIQFKGQGPEEHCFYGWLEKRVLLHHKASSIDDECM